MGSNRSRIEAMINRFIKWAKKKGIKQRVVTFEDKFLFYRYAFMWPDEFISDVGRHFNRPPWWRPFNIFLHEWRPETGVEEEYHDHPRWSITIVLKGELIEKTPWKEKRLGSGSIVIRSRKYIHAFEVPDYAYTLFIVGRRNHRQNTYQITKH
jgi:hypothetical protein